MTNILKEEASKYKYYISLCQHCNGEAGSLSENVFNHITHKATGDILCDSGDNNSIGYVNIDIAKQEASILQQEAEKYVEQNNFVESYFISIALSEHFIENGEIVDVESLDY